MTPPPKPARETFAALSNADLVARFKIGVENFDKRIVELENAQLDTAFRAEAAVGLWPCRVLLGHLADAEAVWNHRLRRAVGEDNPVFALWDENAFIDHHLYGTPETGKRYPIGAFIAAIHTGRQWIGEWLSTLSDAQWARQGLHPERGGITVRHMLELTSWHLEHHAWYLNHKVERLTRVQAS